VTINCGILLLFVGAAESVVSVIFDIAKRNAPCILYIDEIDAILNAGKADEDGAANSNASVVAEFKVPIYFIIKQDKPKSKGWGIHCALIRSNRKVTN
jgi:SpoVK/Ycf46/Vps4 family AAA+-type ATPase